MVQVFLCHIKDESDETDTRYNQILPISFSIYPIYGCSSDVL